MPSRRKGARALATKKAIMAIAKSLYNTALHVIASGAKQSPMLGVEIASSLHSSQ